MIVGSLLDREGELTIIISNARVHVFAGVKPLPTAVPALGRDGGATKGDAATGVEEPPCIGSKGES